MSAIEITVFTKDGGPLTKRISLKSDGTVHSDGSACALARGRARRAKIAGIAELAALIEQLHHNQAIALGALRPGLPDDVSVVTKNQLNGCERDVIARTGDSITYRAGQPTLALLDTDTKGMPNPIAIKIEQAGGVWQLLLSILPGLEGAARVERRSTSSGLSRTDTNEQLPGSKNLHIYVVAKNGSDVERFIKTLHDRLWLAGLGWWIVGEAGQLLERSIIDRMVGTAERLVFEGGPILEHPLKQDEESRRPVAVDGGTLDTLAACPPLTVTERSKVEAEKAKAAHALQSECASARAAWVEHRAARVVAFRPGMTLADAKRVAEQQCSGILLPDVELKFDDDELVGTTVGDVLRDPDRFVGLTLADPVEGDAYKGGPARVARRRDGTLYVHSFAHGCSIYEMKFDAAAVRAAINGASAADSIEMFVKLAVIADLNDIEEIELRDLAMERSGSAAKARAVNAMVKAAKKKRAEEHSRQERERLAAERSDPRPQVAAPKNDAPWQPVVGAINEVLSSSPDQKPAARDIDNDTMRVRRLRLRRTHAFTSAETEQDQ